MLTKFGKKKAALKIGSGGGEFLVANVGQSDCVFKAKGIDGTERYFALATSTSSSNLNYSLATSEVSPTTNNGCYIVVGSDGTAATEDDYCIGTQITGLSASALSSCQHTENEDGTVTAYIDMAISNNTGSDVTIREIARYVSAKYSSTFKGSASSYGGIIMLDRTVLDTPVVIPNGEASTVRYSYTY